MAFNFELFSSNFEKFESWAKLAKLSTIVVPILLQFHRYFKNSEIRILLQNWSLTSILKPKCTRVGYISANSRASRENFASVKTRFSRASQNLEMCPCRSHFESNSLNSNSEISESEFKTRSLEMYPCRTYFEGRNPTVWVGFRSSKFAV